MSKFFFFLVAKFCLSCDRQDTFIGKIKPRQQNSLTQEKYLKQAWVKCLQTENEAKRIFFFFKPKSLLIYKWVGYETQHHTKRSQRPKSTLLYEMGMKGRQRPTVCFFTS